MVASSIGRVLVSVAASKHASALLALASATIAIIPELRDLAIGIGIIALASYLLSLMVSRREKRKEQRILQDVLDQVNPDRLLDTAARQLGLVDSQTNWRLSLYKLDTVNKVWILKSRIASAEIYAEPDDYARFAPEEGVFRSTIHYASSEIPKADIVGIDVDPSTEREDWERLLREAGLYGEAHRNLQMSSRMHCGSSCRVGFRDGHQQTMGVMLEFGRYDTALAPRLESEVGRSFYEALHDLLEIQENLRLRIDAATRV